MESRDNENCTQAYQRVEISNALHTPNVKKQIDEGLAKLRFVFHELRGTRERSRLSLTTSLDTIVSSIASAQGKLTIISEYMSRMFKFYGTGLDRNQVRDLGI